MMRLLLDALRTREGAIYVVGAAVAALLALINFVSIVTSHLYQTDMRQAVHAFESANGEARQLLGELRKSGGGSDDDRATVHVLLGSYNYERSHTKPQLLQSAATLFETALEIDPERTSAAVGLICVRLTQAEEKDKDARERDARQLEGELDRLVGPGEAGPDVEFLRGAILLLQGNVEKAIRKLDVDPDEAPSRQGLGARFWNLGVAELIAGRPRAYQHFAQGYLLRPLLIPNEFKVEPADAKSRHTRAGHAPYLLSMIYRISLSLDGEEPAVLKARCDDVLSYLRPFSKGASMLSKGQLGAYLPHRRQVHILNNALGLAYFKAQDFQSAAHQFELASQRRNHKEPLYLLNKAWALYAYGKSLPEDDKLGRKALKTAAEVFHTICSQLDKKPGREGTVRLARTNSAAIWLMLKNPGGARSVYLRFAPGDPNEADKRRDLGALFDWTRDKKRALFNYRRAIELQHLDSPELEDRVRYWESQ